MSFLEAIHYDYDNMLEGEWSEDVTIAAGTITETNKGIFDLTYEEQDAQGLTVQSKNPRVGLSARLWTNRLGQQITDVTSRTWLFTIRGVSYRASKVQPDGTGLVHVYLKKA